MQDRGSDDRTPGTVRPHREGRNERGYQRGGVDREPYNRGGHDRDPRASDAYRGSQRDHGPDEWRRGYGGYGVSGRGPSPDSGWGSETVAEPPGVRAYDAGETPYREQAGATGEDHERWSGPSDHSGSADGDRGRSMDAWAVPGPHTGRGPQDYRRSESAIREEVCERLTRHGQVDARGINVRVENGEVVLEGDVESRAAKRMAEDAVESVSGVRDVHNRLRVRHRD